MGNMNVAGACCKSTADGAKVRDLFDGLFGAALRVNAQWEIP